MIGQEKRVRTGCIGVKMVDGVEHIDVENHVGLEVREDKALVLKVCTSLKKKSTSIPTELASLNQRPKLQVIGSVESMQK